MAKDAIEPDTKDWTWVLHTPCPECGFQADAVAGTDVPGLVDGYAERWQHVLARPDVGSRPAPQVWSPLEYACHVRDVFRVFAGRARLMLAQDAPTFENWDQDETAIAERYGEQDPSVVAAELAAAAQDAAAAFGGVPADAWDRTGLRSNGSHFTVDSLGRYFVHDVVHHLHDVRG
ncbi:DinB family protein [Cellulomonas sp. KRMCY2]|uniref:DinB family protein n=1 Tax=Cellulomonas sp. KRMCY2 TaxID=1304865 RepID=UPI0004A3184C|nr:DinB family protein [Cellulomonas sp. KRMCY2]